MFNVDLIFNTAEMRREQDRLTRGMLRAGKEGLGDIIREAEKALEDMTRSAVGGRLWRAWGSEVSPKGDRIARDPAAIIIAKGRARTHGAINYLTTNGRVQGRNGGWTAIPLPAAGGRFVGAGRERQSLTPDMWEKRTGLKLRPVFRPGKPPLLVADEAILSGAKRVARQSRAKRPGGGRVTVPIFVLLPDRAFSARFATGPIVSRVASRLPERVEMRARRIGDGPSTRI